MKQSGIVHPDQKVGSFSDFDGNKFHVKTQGKKIQFLTIFLSECLENSSSFFHISDLNSSFLKNQFIETIFFHTNY